MLNVNADAQHTKQTEKKRRKKIEINGPLQRCDTTSDTTICILICMNVLYIDGSKYPAFSTPYTVAHHCYYNSTRISVLYYESVHKSIGNMMSEWLGYKPSILLVQQRYMPYCACANCAIALYGPTTECAQYFHLFCTILRIIRRERMGPWRV